MCGEEKLPARLDFLGNLIVRAADPTGTNLNQGRSVFHRFFKNQKGVFLLFVFYRIQSAVKNFFGGGFLAGCHEVIYKPARIHPAVNVIRFVFVFLVRTSFTHMLTEF